MDLYADFIFNHKKQTTFTISKTRKFKQQLFWPSIQKKIINCSNVPNMIPLHIAKLHFNRVLPDAPFQLDTVPSQAGYADDWCSASFCTACASRSCLQFLAGVLGTVSSSSSRAACFDITLPSPRNSYQPNTFWPVKRQKFHQIDWFLSQFRLARFYHRVMLGGVGEVLIDDCQAAWNVCHLGEASVCQRDAFPNVTNWNRSTNIDSSRSDNSLRGCSKIMH